MFSLLTGSGHAGLSFVRLESKREPDWLELYQ